jgi:uncharacterized LabA/DUF88 family protein
MARTAIFVDLGFFLRRYRHLKPRSECALAAAEVADAVWSTAQMHVRKERSKLYRIFVYDCPPLKKLAHNPISQRAVDFSRTEIYRFRRELHEKLLCKRKVALRLGELGAQGRWIIREAPTKALLGRRITLEELQETDVEYEIRQKGVDIRLGLDLASVAYMRLVDQVVLITGDADFVPAAKLARRQGIDVVLDPLWAPISKSLNEHVDGLNTFWPKPADAKIAAALSQPPAPPHFTIRHARP